MQTYRMIGADGREYGPFTVEQVRQWVAERRANAQTRIRPEESSEWKSLGELPEFAPLFASEPPPPSSPPVVDTGAAQALAQQLLARDPPLQIGNWLTRGWDLVMAHFWLTVGTSFLVFIICSAVGSIPFGGLLLGYVFWGGLQWMFLKLARGQKAELGDAFAGFSIAFVPLLLFSLVCQLLTFLGLLVCILPGIYLLVVWHVFPALLILDKRLEFWDAMEVSRKLVTRHWWHIFGFCLLCLLCWLGGTLVCCVGFFIALPVTTAATVYAYEDMFGLSAAPIAPAK